MDATDATAEQPEATERISRRAECLWLGLVLAVVLAWYWPVLAGRQPSGGDHASFFYPLMAVYDDCLAEGEIPLWNPRWGFGFPGLAESQMGALYPPHLVLFGLLDLDTAYSLNLLVHLLLAAVFAYWCARTFGIGPRGAALAALVFAGGGFFVVHGSHQWAYTSGCWLPLAVLLAWKAGSRQKEKRKRQKLGLGPATSFCLLPFALSLVLAVQMLAGHFQLAFYTQVAVLLLATGRLFGALFARPAVGWRTVVKPWLLIVAAWLSAVALAAPQLLSSWRLARFALPEGPGFEFLSGFANTPLHLVNYLVPLLFHRNPLWRPVAWDPWHTAPEECLTYVGLLPLCLAAGAVWRWRKDEAIRLWALVLVVSVLLSLGPYVPGFAWLIELPGFGWFRSAARWNVVSGLMLGLLAGFALERIDAARLGRWVGRLAAVWVVAVGAVVGGYSWLLTRPPGTDAALPRAVGAAYRTITPWPAEADLDGVLRAAHEPQQLDDRLLRGMARLGYRVEELDPEDLTLVNALPRIARQELLWSVVVLAVVIALGSVARWWPRIGTGVPALVLLVTLADLSMLGLLGQVQWQPRGALRRSPVMRWLAENARGERVLTRFPNLSMAAGVSSLVSYRTLDVPVFADETRELGGSDWASVSSRAKRLARLSGVRYLVVQGDEAALRRAAAAPDWTPVFSADDPLLDAALLGGALAEQLRSTRPEAMTYHVFEYARAGRRAWATPLSAADAARESHGPLPDPQQVTPVNITVDRPERVEIEAAASRPSLLVLTDLFAPGWEATVTGAEGPERVPITSVYGGWRAVELPEPGSFRVVFGYRCPGLRAGIAVAAVALAAWIAALAACLGIGRFRHRVE